jgi:hypothetical protein
MAYANGPKIVTDGLVLCLDAANRKSYPGSGTSWTDLSGNGNNGTLVNGVGYSSNNGGSLVFDGVNDYVNCGNVLNFNYTDVFTLSAWIKRSSTGTGVQNIISKQSMSSPYQGYQFGFNVNTGGSQGYLGVNTIGNYPSHAMGIQTQTTYNDTNWHYVVATYNGNGSYTGLKLYVEGELKTSSYHYIGTSSVSFSNSKDLQIAARDGVNQLFSGSIPQVFIYNKALTPQEIQQNYNALKGRYGLT